MGTQFDIIKRPEPWTTIIDYFHPGYNGLAIVEATVLNLRHIGFSQVFDKRFGKDLERGKENRSFHWLRNPDDGSQARI